MRTSWLGYLVVHVTEPLYLAAAILIAGFLVTHFIAWKSAAAQFICQFATFIGFTSALVIAGVIPTKPTPIMAFTVTFVTVISLKIVWWIASAWLTAGLVRAAFVLTRQPMETRFLQDLLAGIVYIGAILGIVANVFDMPISGLLAASGIVAIVLGLALQSTLSDLFSGVVLNMAKPYHPGDWVILDGGLQGSVVETNWRATQILTLTNSLAIVPNSLIAKAALMNASRPNEIHGLTTTVRLDATMAPLTAVQILETAMLSCDRILHVPKARVAIRHLDAIAVECELTFFVATVEDGPDAQNEVFDRIFRHCTSAGIGLAPPAESAVTIPLRNKPEAPQDAARQLLGHLPMFVQLSEEERLTLAPKMHRRSFKAGETLIEQGAAPPALLILTSGVLAASQRYGATEIEAFRLAPGDCFALAAVVVGGTSPFTFKALTKAVVFEISSQDISPILAKWPAMMTTLDQVMAARIEAGRNRVAGLSKGRERPGSVPGRIELRIRHALHLP
ncbi:mechanosensitive ion channel domain-containing protein [Lichenicola sp.]|uniref:mechanosensitive ion channel domain-containing protein n=1 Tax=Lichenicola sp. TaxID=2804529 RepID=UPI003AFF66EB